MAGIQYQVDAPNASVVISKSAGCTVEVVEDV
jgi:hypothetical protein